MLEDREIIRGAIGKATMPDRLLEEIVTLSVLIDGTIFSGGGPVYQMSYNISLPNLIGVLIHERTEQLCDLFFSREFGSVHRREDIPPLLLCTPYQSTTELGIRYGLLDVKRTDWTRP